MGFWHMNNERHVQRRIVDEKPVSLLAMLAEAFPMITGQHDQRIAI